MPLSNSAQFAYAVDADARLAIARMSGILTGPDMEHIIEAVHRDVAWRPGFDAVWDCSAVEAHAVQPADLDPILDAALEAGGGRDVLVEGPGLAADLFSKLLALRIRRRGGDAVVVESLGEALATLGHPVPPPALASFVAGG